ncbi:MAG: LTA synthase family protein [Synergistales bacterium]|nr:LTA synthase family protein [Synergistales bacterium]
MEQAVRYRRWFSAAFLAGFLVKYNFLSVVVFHVPYMPGLVLKNVILAILISYILIHSSGSRKGQLGLLLFLVFFTAFFFMNIWYNRYFGNYLSLSDVLMGEGYIEPRFLFTQILRVYDPLFAADLLVLWFCRKRLKQHAGPSRPVLSRTCRVAGGILLAALLCVQITLTNRALGDEPSMELFTRSTSGFVNTYGFLPLYVYEYLSFYRETDDASSVGPPPTPTDLTGDVPLEARPNIVVVQLESFDLQMIGRRHNGREVTPFLNDLIREGLFFENFYAQHVNGSFDAEFSFLTSTYPINKNYGFTVNDLSSFTSLVKLLKEKGYATAAFHANDKHFFNRDRAYGELGFDRFFSKEDFSAEECRMHTEAVTFGINDYDFFRQSCAAIEDLPEPFFAFLITATSHTPFDFYPPAERVEAFEDIKSGIVRDYFNSIAFVDKALALLFDRLEELDSRRETLAILYADHVSGIDKPEYRSNKVYRLERQVKPPESVPLLLLHPDLEPAVVDRAATNADLGPTILDLLGEREKPEGFLGDSLLADADEPELFMHENPLVLYRGQLYIEVLGRLEKIGYLKDTGSRDIGLPDPEQIIQTIRYNRQLILQRRKDHEEVDL